MKTTIKENSYFDGKVKSLGFPGRHLPSSVGVMSAGQYQFNTEAKETMSIVAGELEVKLPGDTGFQVFSEGQAFEVEANSRFDVKVGNHCAYLCQYHTD